MAKTPKPVKAEDEDPPVLPTVRDVAVLAIAALTHAMSPNLLSPREAFVSARAFIDEAERQLPVLGVVMSSDLDDD